MDYVAMQTVCHLSKRNSLNLKHGYVRGTAHTFVKFVNIKDKPLRDAQKTLTLL